MAMTWGKGDEWGGGAVDALTNSGIASSAYQLHCDASPDRRIIDRSGFDAGAARFSISISPAPRFLAARH